MSDSGIIWEHGYTTDDEMKSMWAKIPLEYYNDVKVNLFADPLLSTTTRRPSECVPLQRGMRTFDQTILLLL